MKSLYFILCIVFLISLILYKIRKRKSEKEAVQAVTQAASNNVPLDAPCTIHIRVNNTVATQVGGPWKYGFSLNGQPPVFTTLGGEMELQTSVVHNALLGYGRGTYGGYKKPNRETPFRFDAESGQTIWLVSDPQFSYDGRDASWWSKLSREK